MESLWLQRPTDVQGGYEKGNGKTSTVAFGKGGCEEDEDGGKHVGKVKDRM